MRKNRLRAGIAAVLCAVMFWGITVSADVDKLSISQIIQEGNDVYLYLNTLDSEGRPTAGSFSPEQFSVNINKGQDLPVVDASLFQSLGQGVSYIFCIDISRSVTEQEMEEIREAITDFINGMSAEDYARIITIGTEITSVCDSTQSRSQLLDAVDEIQSVADYTYLYKGLSYALEGQRKSVATMPKRAAVILFTDGMDDSDGASSEEQVLVDIAETRIPIYVVGLKGKDSSANLNSVGQIARQSGGSVLSYMDMSARDAVRTISDMMRSTCCLHVQPEISDFGSNNLVWNVAYNADGYSVSSMSYVYSLGLDGVVIPETEAPTEAPTEPPTEAPTEPVIITEATEEVTETETETEPSSLEKAKQFVEDNLIIVIASALILLALIILLICLLRRKKNDDFELDPMPDYNAGSGGVESTLADLSQDDEGTIDEINPFDDEATVDGVMDNGLKLEFEITFDGRTETVSHTLRDQLILGRGEECDVDVCLHSVREDRKQTSRKHAYIMERPDGLYVKDNSRNKTYLNGSEVIGESVLRDEDVLQLGRATVKIRILGY